MAIPTLSPEEATRRGLEVYESQVRPHVEPDHIGRYVVLDIDTGEYAVGDDYWVLVRRLREANPQRQLFTHRVGYPAAGRIGSRRGPIIR